MTHLIQGFIAKNARLTPGALAIKNRAEEITYGDLESTTNQFSRFLSKIGARRGDKIAFYMGKSINSFISLISILKTDAAYVPLDFNSPTERIHFILEDCQCNLLITDEHSLSKALDLKKKYLNNLNIVILPNQNCGTSASENHFKHITIPEDIRFIKFNPSTCSNAPIQYSNIDVDLAYIIYTSGSTGHPKGVMITHRNVIDYASWTTDFFNVTGRDKLSSHAELHFDLSVFDIFTAFMAGASLHLVPKTVSMFPIKFIEFIEENEISIWCSVPSFLTYVGKTGVLNKDRLKSLRHITFCGEVMLTKTIHTWMSECPHIRYINQYGPTETTCASMYYEITEMPKRLDIPIPIGKAIPNTEVFAISEDGRLVGRGETGELYIRGAGNALGYWNNNGKNKTAFMQNPLNKIFPDIVYATGDIVRLREEGFYDYLGRKDNQIKYMGYRIELGEIENALNSLPGVTASAVLGIEDSLTENTTIVAFLCINDVDIAEIKSMLAEKLPEYMIPKKIEVINRLPMNPNGKIDRSALKHSYLASNNAQPLNRLRNTSSPHQQQAPR